MIDLTDTNNDDKAPCDCASCRAARQGYAASIEKKPRKVLIRIHALPGILAGALVFKALAWLTTLRGMTNRETFDAHEMLSAALVGLMAFFYFRERSKLRKLMNANERDIASWNTIRRAAGGHGNN